MRRIAVLAASVAALAGCGGATVANHPSTTNSFQDRAGFESEMGSQLVSLVAKQGITITVDEMHCIKTSPTTAKCAAKVSDAYGESRQVALDVICESVDAEGGHNCMMDAEQR